MEGTRCEFSERWIVLRYSGFDSWVMGMRYQIGRSPGDENVYGRTYKRAMKKAIVKFGPPEPHGEPGVSPHQTFLGYVEIRRRWR